MEHTQIFRRGDIVYVIAKTKSNSLYETDGRYAVVVSGSTRNNRQKSVDVAYIDHNRRYAMAYPVIWHQSGEAVVQCNVECVDKRRVLFIDGHCTKKEMARIDAVIGRKFVNIII